MPTIRLDNALSIVIICVLAICLWFCKIQIIELQKELGAIREDLRSSLIYKFPPKEGWEVEGKKPE